MSEEVEFLDENEDNVRKVYLHEDEITEDNLKKLKEIEELSEKMDDEMSRKIRYLNSNEQDFLQDRQFSIRIKKEDKAVSLKSISPQPIITKINKRNLIKVGKVILSGDETQVFTEKELVEFGKYLLSEEREKLLEAIKTDIFYEDRKREVYDVDIRNWLTK